MKRRGTRGFFVAAALVAAGGGAGVLALSFLEERFIFHPSRLVEMTPDAAGLPYEEVRLAAADGETIAGWFVKVDAPVATVLFLHGNAGNVSHRLADLGGLRIAGFSTLIIDYRGYGESTGSPSERGLYLDARAAWEDLTRRRGVPPERIVLFGESLGSAPALRLALDVQSAGGPGPAAVVLEGAYTSAVEMGRRIFPFLPLRWIVRSRLDNLSAVRQVRAPTMFIHAGADEIVPIEMGRRLHEACAARLKRFHEVPGAHHNTIWMTAGPSIYMEVRSFVEEALAGEDGVATSSGPASR